MTTYDLDHYAERISHYIKRERKEGSSNKLSYEKLGSKLGVPGHTLKRLNEKTARLDLPTLLALADHHKVAASTFLGYLENGGDEVGKKNQDKNEVEIYHWIHDYDFMPWLHDMVLALEPYDKETRRLLTTRIETDPDIVRYLTKAPKINKIFLEAFMIAEKMKGNEGEN